jgi:tetratricopeptide (TPR) repeat protein
MEIISTSQPACQRVLCWRALLPIAFAATVAFTCGCERSGPITNAEAEREANYQRAKKLYEQRDFQAAAEFYKKALSVHPEFANAHMELGLLYDDKLGDPISAIYHYRRYLELRPDSEKGQLVEDFIERAKLSLAAKLPQSPIVDPGELTRLQSEKAALLQENAALRTKVGELEKVANTAAAARPAMVDSAVMPVSVLPTPAPTTIMADVPATTFAEPARARVYIVQKGDTLYSLALRYYGTRAAWDKIYQANRSGLPSKDQLKVGQQLVIP